MLGIQHVYQRKRHEELLNSNQHWNLPVQDNQNKLSVRPEKGCSFCLFQVAILFQTEKKTKTQFVMADGQFVVIIFTHWPKKQHRHCIITQTDVFDHAELKYVTELPRN